MKSVDSMRIVEKVRKRYMGIFDFLKGSNINDGVKKFKETNGAVLLDVRTREEYNQGRIPGSVNIPVNDIHRIDSEITDKDTPLFVYCLSGGRSGQAVSHLKSMGYRDVNNIGGISGYRGLIEK